MRVLHRRWCWRRSTFWSPRSRQRRSPTSTPRSSASSLAKPGALANGPDFTASIARRTAPGQVEIHDKETDIFYIVDGSATFVTGGTMVGGKETRPNQMLGTDIKGGQVHQLKKGDFIAIPAGMPHWFKDVPPSRQLLHGQGREAMTKCPPSGGFCRSVRLQPDLRHLS